MDLYTKQARYFQEAYELGEHGWPVSEPTPFLIQTVKMLLGRRKMTQGGKVLDIGCGEGRHTFACARMGLRAIGIDYQRLAIDRARSMPIAQGISNGYSFLVGNVFSLPFQRDSFDLLIDFGCLHHVRKRDTPDYLISVVPLLKKGGFFILSCFSSRFRHYPGEQRTRDWLVHKGHYDRFFKKPYFRQIFGKDFEIDRIEEERNGLHVFFQVLMRRRG